MSIGLLRKGGRDGETPRARPSTVLARGAISKTTPWLLVAPGLFLIFVFLLYPLLGVVLRSFDPNGLLSYTHPSFSTVNYAETWSDPVNRIILRNTFVIAAVAAAVTVVIAYPTAAFLARLPAERARLLLLLALFPFWVSVVVRMYAMQLILGKVGVLFSNTATVIGMVSYLLPYLIIIFYGGMVGIDSDLIRAARSLGARPTRAFWHVFVPLSRPVLLAGTLLVFIIGLGFFITPALLGAPSGITVSMFIQQQVEIGRWGVAAAMGVGLLVAALIVYYAFNVLFDIERLAGSGAQVRVRDTGWNRETSRLTRWGLGVWASLAFLFLLLPLIYVVLVSFSAQSYLTFPPTSFSLRWYRALFSEPTWAESAWLSVRVALLATLFAMVAGVLAAVALARGKLPARKMFRALFMLPLIVPVVLIAAAEFDIENRLRLSGTVLGYAVGHSILALPFVVVICSTALQQLGTSLEEAARSLGANWFAAFRKVTLPLIFPSLIASAAFAFITSWDEPVMSLFLRGLTPTLPVHIFQSVKQSIQPTVAALSTVILVGVVLVAALVFATSRLRRLPKEPPVGPQDDYLTEASG
ncbi:MAG: ABC transporter permease subunit [Actinobacteria bacterium]|nr:ABC transporter permease subunit [Actinomycetota bacterium]